MAGRYYGSTTRSRSGRERGSRGAQGGDAVVTALTLQIFVCIILVAAASIAKKMDEPRYASIKSEFVSLTGSPSSAEQFSAYFSELSELGGGFFAAVENFLNGFQRQEDDTPLPEAPAEESQPESELPAQFSYDYLKDPAEPEDSSAAESAAGRDIPKASIGDAPDEGDMLDVPAGSTLAPVSLSARMIPPLSGLITSPFSYRIHPISGETDFHTGFDIAAPQGSGILAALPGEVEEVGYSDTYGNYIILRHAMNLQTFYAHCSEIIATEGMKIAQGQRIAKVGQTGVATGPHLHFSVLVDGLFTDPSWVLGEYMRLVEDS